MRGILFLVDHFGSTIVDSQVLAHARDMRASGVEMEVWCFAPTATDMRRSRANLDAARARAGGPVRLFRGVRPGLPGSIFLNACLLILRLALRRPGASFIHARADYAGAVAACASRLLPHRILWDCRGDHEAQVGLGQDRQDTPALRYERAAWRKRRRLAARGCDGAIVVSDALLQEVGPLVGGRPAVVIPSCASERLFHFDPALRTKERARLGLGDEDRAILYSGSMAPHQGLEELKALFRRLTEDPAACILVVSPEPDAARALIRDLPADRARVLSAAFEEMNGLLCAADAGVLWRAEDDTNRVASPVKMAEYALTGLPVLMKAGVPQAWDWAGECGLRVTLDPWPLVLPDPAGRAERAERARRRWSRESYRRPYMDLYAHPLAVG